MATARTTLFLGLLASVALTGVHAGHSITVVNKCGSTVQPTIVDTSCTYSPARCGHTNSYGGPWKQSVNAGAQTVFNLPDNFVGRLFDAASGNCGSDGWGCSLLEYNFDNGAGPTDQSYDLSNIQGFTRGMQAVPWPQNAGCEVKTCFSQGCDPSQAYPPNDTGDNAANTSCGAANLGITLYLCGN